MGKIAIKESAGYRRSSARIEKNHYYNYGYGYKPPLRIVLVGVSRFHEGDNFKRVNRPMFSMNIITAGNADWKQEDKSGTLYPGDVFLAHTGKSQYFVTGSEGFVHKRFIMAEGPVLDTILQSTGLAEIDYIRPVSPRKITRLFQEAYAVMKNKSDDFVLRLSLILYEILHELGKSMAPDHPPELRRAVEMMRRSLHLNIDLDFICQEMNFSRRHCNRLFHKYLEMAPMQFFNNQKLEWSQKLFMNTEMSVKQIAATLGYEDPVYFSNQFKKRFGVAPSLYRNSMLSKNK